MKKVKLKKITQICSMELGGCGRVILPDEVVWKQSRTGTKSKIRGYSRRYLCVECYDRKTV